MGNSSFRDLRIWQKGYELIMKVYDMTSKYPIEEKYGLISDSRRSANSIIANIAESHGRFYFADKVRVLLIARGEVEELRSHLSVAKGRKYLSETLFQELDFEYGGLGVGFNASIDNLEMQDNKKFVRSIPSISQGL